MSTQYDNLMRFLKEKHNLPYEKYIKKSDNLKEPIIITDNHIKSLELGCKYQEIGKLDYKVTFGNYTSFQRYLKEYIKIKNQFPELLKDYIEEKEDTSKVQELENNLEEIKRKLDEKEILSTKLNNKIRELEEIIQNKDKIIQDMEQTNIESYFVDEDNEKDQLIESLKNTAKLNDTVINNLKSYINDIKIDLIYFEQAYKYLQLQNQSKNLEEKLKHIPYFKTQLKNECEKSNVSYNELQQKYKI